MPRHISSAAACGFLCCSQLSVSSLALLWCALSCFSMHVMVAAQSCLNHPMSCGQCNPGHRQQYDTRCCPCDAGQYGQDCSDEQWCSLCAAGTYNPSTGSTSLAACVSCDAGTYNPNPGSTSSAACMSCAAGSYSGAGQSACTPCAAGTYNPYSGSTSSAACLQCPANFYCLQASSQPAPCPTGTASTTGAYSIDCCRRVSPVSYGCSWSQAALSAPRSAAASASLPPRDAYPSGLVLFAGGSDASTGVCSAVVDILDAATKVWSTAVLSSPRCAVASAALPLQVNQTASLF
jgi:hypothetical protein